jgi:hypothetical protein
VPELHRRGDAVILNPICLQVTIDNPKSPIEGPASRRNRQSASPTYPCPSYIVAFNFF